MEFLRGLSVFVVVALEKLAAFDVLLVRVASTTLAMIDEPELSPHVVWQNEFADDLLRIAKLRGFDVLIATHSPDIIGKRWDLTVELKPPHDLAANA